MADCREELEGEEIKRFIADDNGGADGVGRVGYCGGFFYVKWRDSGLKNCFSFLFGFPKKIEGKKQSTKL